jgi:hypothetical protein
MPLPAFKNAELPACPVCGITCLSLPAFQGFGITCLSKIRNYLPVWDAELSACLDAFRGCVFLPACLGCGNTGLHGIRNSLATSVCGITYGIGCRIDPSAFLRFVCDCPSVCQLACHGCGLICPFGMRHYLPAYDAELPGCVITNLSCPGCRITSLSRM